MPDGLTVMQDVEDVLLAAGFDAADLYEAAPNDHDRVDGLPLPNQDLILWVGAHDRMGYEFLLRLQRQFGKDADLRCAKRMAFIKGTGSVLACVSHCHYPSR